MTLALEPHSHADIVRMPDRMDAAGAERLRADLLNAISAGSGRLLLDMAPVKYIDSTGLGVLVTAKKAATGRNGGLALFALPAKVRAMVELTRLHLHFEIYADEASALVASSS